jgi:hypothetical protein
MPIKKERAENCQRVDVADAAAEIGCHPQYLRQMMRSKKWDLGRVVMPQTANGQCMYLIFRAKLDKFLGIERVEA